MKTLKICSKCGKSGKFYDDPCGKCKDRKRQKELTKSVMPRFVYNRAKSI